MIYGRLGVGKTTYGLGLLRLLVVAYLGAKVPSQYAKLPIFDVIGCSICLNRVKEQNFSSFESELRRMENLLYLSKQFNRSIFVIDNYGESTT